MEPFKKNPGRAAALSVLTGLLLFTNNAQAQVAGNIAFPPSTPLEQARGNFVTIPTTTTAANGETIAAEFRLPLPVGITNPVVPTDVTGIGGSLGYSQNLRHRILGPDRNTLPDSHNIVVARDARYSFTGCWTGLWQSRIALEPSNGFFPSIATLPEDQDLTRNVILQQSAVVVPSTGLKIERALNMPAVEFGSGPMTAAPQIMLSADAQVSVRAPNEMLLKQGAVLVKSSDSAVYITVPLAHNQSSTIAVKRGAIAVVSNLNGHLTVANLHDNDRNTVTLSMTDATNCLVGSTPIRLGYLTEAYCTGAAIPENEIVAYVILSRNAFSNGYTVETSRFSYPRLLKRFNLTCKLPVADLRTIAKSAAAISYTDREREWNGLTPIVR